MNNEQTINEIQKAITSIYDFITKELISRITSQSVFEIMRDCPELLDGVRNLQSYRAILTSPQKLSLEKVISTLENQINLLLDKFRDALSKRDNDPDNFEEKTALQIINEQHRRLCSEYEDSVAEFLQQLQKDDAFPGVQIGLSGPTVDVTEWWNWVKEKAGRKS